MDEKPTSIFRKILDDLINLNPLYILLGLFVLLAFAGLWVWRTINAPPVQPTPRFSHPSTLLSPFKMLTERALTSPPPTLTPVPAKKP